MERMLYWSVRWPWLAAIAVFAGLTLLPLGPWYVSAWFVIGAALVALTAARTTRLRLAAVTQQAAAPGHRVVRIRPDHLS